MLKTLTSLTNENRYETLGTSENFEWIMTLEHLFTDDVVCSLFDYGQHLFAK